MFNLKKAKKDVTQPYEKYLRDHNLGPKADDEQPIGEKMLPHRVGDQYVTTEKQMEEANSHVSKDARIIEKVLDEAKSYIPHRSAKDGLSVLPLATEYEKTRKERLNDWKPDVQKHWTLSFNNEEQLGDLPEWPDMKNQHDKIVTPNDDRRFKGDSVEPLVGNITKADANKLAYQIKTGASLDYDTAIVAILRESETQKRELTEVEKKAINDLKIKRTQSLLGQKC